MAAVVGGLASGWQIRSRLERLWWLPAVPGGVGEGVGAFDALRMRRAGGLRRWPLLGVGAIAWWLVEVRWLRVRWAPGLPPCGGHVAWLRGGAQRWPMRLC